ncbi:MAG: membrane protein insertion efficiency factor YidD [Firmicutes bacterium]|nr:membrane protein insertion efficiency factor YidD [Bacillota bacterium]
MKRILINIITFKWLFLGLILFYRYCISPLLPKSCIYYPTCSAYMLEAIGKFGAFKGVWLGVKRILRCRPGREGGFDPVPDNPKGDLKWLL